MNHLLTILTAITLLIPVHHLTRASDSLDEWRRPIQFVNESGHRLEVYWVSPDGEMVIQSTPHVINGATLNLNSFVSHTFQVRELPSLKSGECAGEDKTCRVVDVQLNDKQNQVFYIKPGLGVNHVDDSTRAMEGAKDLMTRCEEKALLEAADPDKAASAVEDLMACVKTAVAAKLAEAQEEVNFQASIRTVMGNLWENYTCADQNLTTTPAMENRTWTDKQRVKRHVSVLHEQPNGNSKIHFIKDFISDDECEAMEKAAKPMLHQATVADDTSGGSKLSDSRKAMQAGIRVPWSKEKDGDPIARLSRRVYDYTNHATDFKLEEFGQEDLMSIQYFGRGEDDESPDRYKPHCDGDCTGLDHKHGTRVATMVMYCTIPEKGGATNFKNAGIHIVPEKGAAVFFAYMGPDHVMDKGFTEHSGCPVITGEKKIVTQWMRYGVDAENPWNSFNTLGVKYSDMD